MKKIKTQAAVDEWYFKEGKLQFTRSMTVPSNFAAVARKVVRDLFLERKKLPTIDDIYFRITTLTVADIADCQIEGQEMLEEDEQVWTWG